MGEKDQLNYLLEEHFISIGLNKFRDEYLKSEDFKNWKEDYLKATNEIHKILINNNFENTAIIKYEDFSKICELLKIIFHENQSSNISLIKINKEEDFFTKLKELYYGEEDFAIRFDNFLDLKGVREHTASEFLVGFDCKKYPISTSEMRESINLNQKIIDLAKEEAFKKFNINDESKFKEDTLSYITYYVIYEILRDFLNLDDFFQINMILWRFGNINQFRNVVKEFYDTYFNQEEGQNHKLLYEQEKNEVKKIYNEILELERSKKDFSEKLLNYLLPFKRRIVFPAGVYDLSSYPGVEKKDFPIIAKKLLDLIKVLLNEEIDESQKKIKLEEFDESGYRKGIQQGILSSVLYSLDPDNYFIINKKTRDAIKFLSRKIFGKKNEISINDKLIDYIENNKKVRKFWDAVSEIEPLFVDFDIFDEFCYWMCDKTLGGYINGDKDYHKDYHFVSRKPIIEKYFKKIKIDFNKKSIPIRNLYFEDKKIDKRIIKALKNGKHIILIGPPGTGKSKLAQEICEYYCGKNNYIMTTATSEWSTFETIGGYHLNEEKKLEFKPGLFLQCFSLENSFETTKWLIIDEINRADIDKAFGSLFSALIKDNIEIPYKKNNKRIRIIGNPSKRTDVEKFYDYIIPDDWRIIATMNTYDKSSLYEMSYAFMRRFAFILLDIPKEINENVLEKYLDLWNINVPSSESDDLKKNIAKLWNIINKYRKIGPAIVEDIIRFVSEGDERDYSGALILHVFPQFEGLDNKEIDDFLKNLSNLDFLDENNKKEIKNYLKNFFIIGE
ncbi:MAG: AAA family ATPase [Promethearchaeota archaeon]